MHQGYESSVQFAGLASGWDKENEDRNRCHPGMDARQRNLLKPSFNASFTHDCSSWLSNHSEANLKIARKSPTTWSENIYRVEIKTDTVDLICVRRKFHQTSHQDQRNESPDDPNKPKKYWQVFGEGVEMSQSRSFSRRAAVVAPPIPAPRNLTYGERLPHRAASSTPSTRRPFFSPQTLFPPSFLTFFRLASWATAASSARHQPNPSFTAATPDKRSQPVPSPTVAWPPAPSAAAHGEPSPYSAAVGTRRPANPYR